MDFSLVLPCYNEEKNIDLLYKEYIAIPNILNFNSEIIFVNNGSTDKTEVEIDKIISINQSKYKNIFIKKLNLQKNQGYGGGISEGLKITNGRFIGWAHADLQTPLIDFFKLFQIIQKKNIVYGKGTRINNRGYDGIISRFHEKLASLVLDKSMKEINAQPKIFSRNLLDYFKKIPKKWTTIDTYTYYVCLINNIEVVEYDVVFRSRIHGFSKWKNNLSSFLSHVFFNTLYLFKLKFQKNKKHTYYDSN